MVVWGLEFKGWDLEFVFWGSRFQLFKFVELPLYTPFNKPCPLANNHVAHIKSTDQKLVYGELASSYLQ